MRRTSLMSKVFAVFVSAVMMVSMTSFAWADEPDVAGSPEAAAEPNATDAPDAAADPDAVSPPGAEAGPGATDQPGAEAGPGAVNSPDATADPDSSESEAVDIADATVAPIPDQTYTGSAKEPKLKVTLDGELAVDQDYTVEYDNNVNVGTAVVTITGAGAYIGTKVVTFEIVKPKDIAVFDPSDGSLTFYSQSNPSVPFPDGARIFNVPMDLAIVPWVEVSEGVSSVSFADQISPGATAQWFSCMFNCTSMDLANLDTSNVTFMFEMFMNSDSLSSLDLSGWDTSNATDMDNMFRSCRSLESLDLSGWDTSNVTDMEDMFGDCFSLESLDLSGWNTSNVTNMHDMFSACPYLSSLDLTGWDTSNVTNMDGMFYCCSSLESLDLSGWDTSNVTNMKDMFYGCTRLSQITLAEGFRFQDDCGFDRALEGWSWAKGSPDSDERYTSDELVSSYDGATMAGTYYWSENPASVHVGDAKASPDPTSDTHDGEAKTTDTNSSEPEANDADSASTSTSPKTGDDAPVNGVALLSLMSVALVLVSARKIARRKED